MKDSLKDFIDANREGFDNRVPTEDLWPGIARGIGKQSPGLWHSVQLWRAAAAVLFVVTAALLAMQYQGASGREVSRLQGEFTDLEMFYKGQIAEKVAMIDRFDYNYEDDQYTQDVQKLDAMYQVLREEMKRAPSEQVRDALVLNMLIRIDLLNQQIKKLEDARKKQGEVSGT